MAGGDSFVPVAHGTYRAYLALVAPYHLGSEAEYNASLVPLTIDGKRLRVMAIDDEEPVTAMLQLVLDPLGCDVTPFNSPVKALEYFKREKDKFDLILLDFYMPHLDGAKTFEWIKQLNPSVKIILCSGAEGLRIRQFAAQYAVDGYIRKPFSLAEAYLVIQEVMAKPAKGVKPSHDLSDTSARELIVQPPRFIY